MMRTLQSAVPIAILLLATTMSIGCHTTPTRSLSSFDAQAKELLARMTLDEKVGQMTQADQQHLTDPSDVATYFLGSVLSGGDSDPPTNSMQDWTDRVERVQAHALATRLRIPILYGIDAVHGHNNVLGATIFPHNIGLGATRNAALVEEIGRATAREVRATGMQWTFAPCVAVVRDERWGRHYEGFSEDPQLVAELGAAAVRGLQGKDLNDPERVLACAKHFAGDGGTVYGTGTVRVEGSPDQTHPLDRGDTRLSEAELKRLHLAGYDTAIDAGVGSIMASYSSWNGELATGSKHLLTDILKGELKFEGILISDYDAVDTLPGDFRSNVKQAITAGIDMVMVSRQYRELIETLKDLVSSGDVSLARIDDAVLRILRVKLAMGLFAQERTQLADRTLQPSFGSAPHRELARRAVRESLVLLKNERNALPLSKTAKRIHVIGRQADDLGSQCGGWTVTWQGASGNSYPGGTTILSGLKAVSAGVEVTYSAYGSGAAGADAVVVVVGEMPYAEFKGDREDLSLPADAVAAVANAKKSAAPVVLVLVTGRPLILGDTLAQADAVLVAWLPGSEGQGVADVLFGDHKPTGKLPVSWPRSMAQIPINVGDVPYDPLFPFGFGLTYER